MEYRPVKKGSSWVNSLSRTFAGIIDPLGRDEMERIDDRCTRVLLVARTRWMMLTVFGLYAICAAACYSMSSIGFCFSASQTFFLFLAVALVVVYNAVLGRSCATLRKFAGLLHLQIALDLIFVTTLIHFTGGIVSWFWPAYLLVTLEAVFLFDSKKDVWLIGTVGGLLYGALLVVEGVHLLPPVAMPFVNTALYDDFLFQMLQWLWVAGMNAMVALIGVFLMDVLRRDRALVKESEDALLGFINSSSDLIFCCSPDGTVIFSNQTCRELFSLEEYRLKSLYDFFVPEGMKS